MLSFSWIDHKITSIFQCANRFGHSNADAIIALFVIKIMSVIVFINPLTLNRLKWTLVLSVIHQLCKKQNQSKLPFSQY